MDQGLQSPKRRQVVKKAGITFDQFIAQVCAAYRFTWDQAMDHTWPQLLAMMEAHRKAEAYAAMISYSATAHAFAGGPKAEKFINSLRDQAENG